MTDLPPPQGFVLEVALSDADIKTLHAAMESYGAACAAAYKADAERYRWLRDSSGGVHWIDARMLRYDSSDALDAAIDLKLGIEGRHEARMCRTEYHDTPLYAHPAPRPLTDEQIRQIVITQRREWTTYPEPVSFARAIEAAHGITGEQK